MLNAELRDVLVMDEVKAMFAMQGIAETGSAWSASTILAARRQLSWPVAVWQFDV
jgi:hypothetical protein